jgi:ubiquinone/menaquinone biosynthesis C-methylase UbiE
VSRNRTRDIEATRAKWDERANRYDAYYKTFKGAVEHHVDWELLRRHLPQNRNARILDAAGGTGRTTLPLAQMGFSVALCDISPRMLDVARQKLLREGVLNKVEILECDICDLPFSEASFDCALCWNGMLEAAGDVLRVTKQGGTISILLVNRCRGALDTFAEDPAMAVSVVTSRSDHVCYGKERYRVVRPEEARKLLEAQGIRVLATYAPCGWMDMLAVPKEVQDATEWDQALFTQVTEMSLALSQERCVQGMSQHLVVYGERI